jgi:hypothetical protein
MTDISLETLASLQDAPETPVDVSLKDAPLEFRLALLNAMDMQLHGDGVHVVRSDGSKVLDPYVNEWIRVDHMMILPGSVTLLDDNLVSVACYLEDHKNALE